MKGLIKQGYLVRIPSDKDGRSARKTQVHLGRQNPLQVEVLEGLAEGDVIITSGYDTFNSVDELQFTDSIKTIRGSK